MENTDFNRNKKWKRAHVKFLKSNYPLMTAQEIGKALGRTKDAVKQAASYRNIKKRNRVRQLPPPAKVMPKIGFIRRFINWVY